MTSLAFTSKSPYVPSVEQGRWIASLSDGQTIFEDKTPGERSAWVRLREHLEVHKLKITSLRLEAYGRRAITIPYRNEDGEKQVNGFWQSSRIGAFLNSNMPQLAWRGIGYIRHRRIYITWIAADGSISQEERDLFQEEVDNGKKVRHYDMGAILNDPI